MSHFVAVSGIRSVIRHIIRQPRGDPAERLGSFLTVTLLALISAVLMTSHFWGEPITCWTPAEYPSWWSQFVNQYCYVHGTYYAPLNRPLAWDANERREITIGYYQWVPYMLAVQSAFFYLPRFAWKSLCSLCGIDVPALVRHVDDVWRDCCSNEAAFIERIERMQSHAVPYIWDSLRIQRRRNLGVPTLFACYLMTKVLHALNAVLQWIWLNEFLKSPHYKYWGWQILKDLREGIDWQTTGHFPRITHCDFSRRKEGSFSMESVTCVLTLNVYYEKIFIFLWFWLLFVSTVNVISAIYWLGLFCCTCCHSGLVHKYLSATNDLMDDDECMDSDEEPVIPVESKQHVSMQQTSFPSTLEVTTTTAQHTGILEAGLFERNPAAGVAGAELPGSTPSRPPKSIPPSPIDAAHFTSKCLQMDGMLLIRLIGINLGDLPAAYLTRALYRSVDARRSQSLARFDKFRFPSNIKLPGKQV